MLEASEGTLREMRVLVVEDDQAVANSLHCGLEALGWKVCVAASSAEAFRCLEENADIWVVVTDIRMPEGSGLQLAASLMDNRPASLAIEVIIITGHSTTEDVTSAMRLGACDFLHKPFRLEEVNAAIAKAAKRASVRRVAACATQRDRRAETHLAAEIAALHAQLGGLQQEAAGEVISKTLRAPLRDISDGAGLLEADGADIVREKPLELLRAGVQQAVAAIELLEEFNGTPLGQETACDLFDLSSLVESVVRRVATTTGVTIMVEPAAQARPLVVLAAQAGLARAVALCLEAAIEWAPAGSQIWCGLEALRKAARSEACVTILATPARSGTTQAPDDAGAEPAAGGAEGATESLRLLLARRLAGRSGGSLSSWDQQHGEAGIRLTLPLAPSA